MGNELANVVDGEVVSLPQNDERDALAIIERRNKVFDQVLAVAIKSTSSSDWVDQNGKPYLQSSGCEKAARRFAVKIYDTRTEREDLEDDNGRYYLYTVTGKAAMGTSDSVEVIGTCSSRDKFFGKTREGLKQVQDVDIANIKKKAFTNFFGNAIRKLLGLNNLTWEDLANYGINRDGKTQVSYQKKGSHTTGKPGDSTAGKSSSNNRGPYWTSEYNGDTYIWVKAGQHFGEQWLKDEGFRESQKSPGSFSVKFTPEMMQKIEQGYKESCEILGG